MGVYGIVIAAFPHGSVGDDGVLGPRGMAVVGDDRVYDPESTLGAGDDGVLDPRRFLSG